MTQEIENILMAYQGLGDDRVVTVTLGALRALTTPTPAPVVREPVACADRGMCELHDRERRELLAQETVMGQRIMELEAALATATADARRYQWLKENVQHSLLCASAWARRIALDTNDPDAAIDAARAGAHPSPETTP
jgi:hypothetical protein